MTLIYKSCRAKVINQVFGNAQSSIEEPVMKVGIMGTGAVGSACALALVMRGAAPARRAAWPKITLMDLMDSSRMAG
jgi:hypothetical protein